MVAASLAVLTAFSTAPSALYGIYARQDHLTAIAVTLIYSVYAAGILVSLLLVGHLSDWYGRRALLVPAALTALVATLVFATSSSLPALFLGRVVTGIALGAAVAAATAYLTDLDAGPGAAPTRRAQIVATVANVGGLATGPLLAGLLVEYVTAGPSDGLCALCGPVGARRGGHHVRTRRSSRGPSRDRATAHSGSLCRARRAVS